MSPPSSARVLYRIGRMPDPVSYPDWRFVGGERFDDPAGQDRVLYAGEDPRACYLETLSTFRTSMVLLARLNAMSPAEDDAPLRGNRLNLDEWRFVRRIATLYFYLDQPWLNLRDLQVRETTRRQMASTFLELGLSDFDMGDALTRDRRVTRAISRWAFEQDYRAIAYSSRFDASRTWVYNSQANR